MGPTVKIGDGATISVGSDSYPATVIRVTPKTITIQHDWATCSSCNSHNSEAQDWYIVRDPNGVTEVARWSEKYQRYQIHKTPVYVGHRRRHHDPCF